MATVASVAVAVLVVLGVGPAQAFWNVDSASGGTGASSASTVDRGATPTASASGGSVTVEWSATTLTSGRAVSGYVVQRYDAATLSAQNTLNGCGGVISATTCVESAVPDGQWVYSVTPRIGTSWSGQASMNSNPVTSDATPPANALTATPVTGNAFMTGSTVFYRGLVAGSFTLTNAVDDSGSRAASSTTATLSGDSTGWTHAPSTVSSPAGGPYVSNAFTWTAGTVSAPSEVVTGADVAGNTASTALAFVDDSTAPAGGSVTYANGYQPGQSVLVTFTTGTDTGSGIATRQLQRSSATLTHGTCGTFTSFADVGPASPVSPYNDVEVADGSCDAYRYLVTDQVGNQSVATNANVAWVDSSAGGPKLGSAGTYSVLAGTGIANTGATSLSGDLGLSPSTLIAGFPPGTVAGTLHIADPSAAQAQTDLTTAYNDAAGRTPDGNFAGDLNGRTFTEGVYHTNAALALTGTLTLDAQGDPNAIFIFQVNAAMNTAAASHVNLINGAQASHVYWVVNGAAGTGANSTLAGTIMSNGAITLGDSTQLTGRALAYGTITLANNLIKFSSATPPTITIDPPLTAWTKDTTPTLSGTTNAPAAATVTVTLASQVLTTTVQSDGTWSVTAAALTAGTYDVVASVRDSAGNAGSATQSLNVEVNPSPVQLGSAGTYSVLAGTGIANTGATSLSGDLGLSPSTLIAGFPPGTVAGTLHIADPSAAQAQTDLTTAYNDAAGRTPDGNFAGDLNGRTFTEGVYHTNAALALTGTLTLDAQGDPNAIFIFQVNAAMNTAAASHVNLINGAQASHVYWVVNGAAGTGANSTLAGTIMSNGAITLGDSTQLTGRALAYGTITLANNPVS